MAASYSLKNLQTLFAQGKFEDIIHHSAQFKRANDKNSHAMTILAVSFAQLGQTQKALPFFQNVTAANPNDPQAWNNYGNALRTLISYDGALKAYDKALKLNPRYTEALNGRGGVLMDLGQIDNAIESYQKLMAIDPDHPEVNINLVYAYVANGNFELAEELLLALLKKNPRHADAHHQFSRIHRYQDGDPHLVAMENALKSPNPSLKETVLINHGLGKAEADLKNYKKAFDHWTKANHAFQSSIGYQFAKDQKVFDTITRWGDVVSHQCFHAPKDKRPIFILGMPRSGTSLVEQILSGHSEVYAAGEVETLGRIIPQIAFSASRIGKPILKQISQGYLDDLRRLPTDKAIITDKMPLNFKWVGVIRAIFPEAPILHLKRHPMAICFSNFRNFFRAEGMSYSHDLMDIGRFYLAYDALMQHWYELYGEAITTVDYEKLTENPKEEIAKLLQVVGLDWQDACLKIEDNKRSVKTVSNTQIRQKIYTKSSEEWQHYEEELAPLKEMLMPILERDGWV
jgi:tetratricopeptide (TPR) repeat protein